MDSPPEPREVNKTCGECSLSLQWAVGQARCLNLGCPLYWKGQGGIETLVPSQGYIPTAQPAAMVIQKPQDL